MIAYFSMEMALEAGMPTYSGGLGVLAGDLIRSAADMKIPMVGVTLLHRKGYFHQQLDSSGWQTEEPVEWVVEDFLKVCPQRASIQLEGRTVSLQAWRYEVKGIDGFVVPVYLLDTDLPENAPQDRGLTSNLYGGDTSYRLCQEAIFGIGGVKMLRVLGHDQIHRFHMNEGHASLLTLALLEERAEGSQQWALSPEDLEYVRRHCVFTTHTPIPAGHDQFPVEMVQRVLGHAELATLTEVFGQGEALHMSKLGIHLSHQVNGVSRKHGEISRQMFAPHPVGAITNGVHAVTWTSPSFQELFDRLLPEWRRDNLILRRAMSLPLKEVWAAHMEAKRRLIRVVNRQANSGMDVELFTIGFARRAATYKRGDLFLHNVERLEGIASQFGSLQFVFAGKAHPQDQKGKEMIQRILQAKATLKGKIKIAYLENYDIELAKLIVSGVDLWLNTPEPPLEASGTSGMKAALNGVPSLSVLDGWWLEGCLEGITGWAIGEKISAQVSSADRRGQDAASLYDKLEKVILPLFSQQQDRFIEVMRQTIALNGSFFNTQRMLQQYVVETYF